MVEMESNVSEDVRTLAALGHATIILPSGSLILSLILYYTQRDKSRFAAFHGLQAFVFQVVVMVIELLVMAVSGGLFAWVIIARDMMREGLAVVFVAIAVLLVIALWIASLVMGFVAAYRIWKGGDYRYPIIGKWLESRSPWNGERSEATMIPAIAE